MTNTVNTDDPRHIYDDSKSLKALSKQTDEENIISSLILQRRSSGGKRTAVSSKTQERKAITRAA